jgi:U3 small nucleolar RNA-associated protein 24
MINPKDDRLKSDIERKKEEERRKALINKEEEQLKEQTKEPSHLFFKFNTALGPPYRILLDTNFLNFSI